MYWKTLDLYPDYEISEHGDVVNKKTGRLCMHRLSPTARYISVCIKDVHGQWKYPFVHRLVGLAYVPNPLNHPYIDHINRNRKDNHYLNLRWATPSQQSLNSKINRLNRFGVKGISYDTRKKVYVSQSYLYAGSDDENKTKINKYIRRLRKGFKTLEEAILFRKQSVMENYNLIFYNEK